MSDSYTEAVFDFADCAELREEYLTYSGTIRVGRLLEDLDALAGTIAFRHCDDNNSASFPLSIVTASVDSISLLNKLTPDRLVSFEKLPRWACTGPAHQIPALMISVSRLPLFPDPGTCACLALSPMWARAPWRSASAWTRPLARATRYCQLPHPFAPPLPLLLLPQPPPHPPSLLPIQWEKMLTARLTMVARDPRTGRAAPINRLVCETDEERTLFEQGRRNTQLRKEGAQMSLSKQPPSESERLIIHDLYLASQPFEDNGALARDFFWVGETRLDGLHVCHPAEQNTNNKIFGGFLMRTAFELAWASACRHCQTHAFFLAVDEIHFLAPVEVGSLLQLTSNITFTAGGSMQCRVVATAINPRTGESKCATQLHFTFVASEQKTVRPVVPRTYSEAMLYIGGRRRLLAGRAIAREENSPMAAYYGED